MEAQRPFIRRNIICALLLGTVAAGYWLSIGEMMTDMQRAAREGQHGEAGSMALVVLIPLALYTSLFFAATLSSALQRGSPPMRYWLLALGLLPTIILLLLSLSIALAA
jgi:hypothetical protein